MGRSPAQPPFTDFSDTPLYNIQAVVELTGVPAMTLRTWERRYGQPSPHRDAGGRRLYSDRDIEVARWLARRLEEGINISRAVDMLSVVGASDIPSPMPADPLSFERLQARMVAAARRLNGGEFDQVVYEALASAQVEHVALRLFQPALHQIGELWAAGDLSSSSEHFASQLIRDHLARLLGMTATPNQRGVVVVGCAPGEQHELGALTFALFIRRAGYSVVYLGANVEPEALKHDLKVLGPDALCVSATTVPAAEATTALYRDLITEFDGVLAFGGQAYHGQPEEFGATPGTYLGPDAEAALEALRSALSAARH